MNCDCVTKVNKKLADNGLEYNVSSVIVFDDKMQGETRLEIGTYWRDPLKRRKKKPPSILCTYCPFCGVKATDKV